MMSEHSAPSDDKRMRLRFAGVCRVCAVELQAGEFAVYERTARRVRCLGCPATSQDVVVAEGRDGRPIPAEGIVLGSAGASAQREYDRRKSSRKQRIRAKHPKLGGLILALSDEPQSTRAWERGASGEEQLAARLMDLPAAAKALHDRRIPGTRANIDHIVIAPSGVWVIDAKRYKGKRPVLHVEGGIVRPRVEALRIGGRDGTKLVDGVHKQVSHVRAALEEVDVPVRGALCFLEADWPMIGGSFVVDGIQVLWPRLLVKRINDTEGQVVDIDDVCARLAASFPVA